MPLDLKPIGKDDFETILAEAKARIPVHTPEWSHTEASDPGITILELFAFMSESLLYRANTIPERNRVKFLQLLRLGLRPAAPAKGFVVFDGKKQKDHLVVKQGTGLLAGKIPFRTTTDVTVLPIEAQILYKKPTTLDAPEREDYSAAYEGFRATDADQLQFYETTPFPEPAPGSPLPQFDAETDAKLDRSVWIALIAPKGMKREDAAQKIGGRTLSIGIMPALKGSAVISPFSALRKKTATTAIAWEISTKERRESGASAAQAPRYEPLAEVSSDADVLQEPGIVNITLPEWTRLVTWEFDEPTEEGAGDYPPRMEDEEVRDRVIAWIRMRLRGKVGADISWIGVNATKVLQATEIRNELLGKGTGEPDQVLTTSLKPVLADTLVVEVEERVGATSTWTRWKRVDDFLASYPEHRAERIDLEESEKTEYVLDPESGEIRFGNGIAGKRPPNGARVRASYQAGGGIEGNVPIGAISKAPSVPIPVTNPLPARGGAATETVAEAERRIPSYLRHRNRAVSKDDFEEIVKQTPGVDIGRVDVLPIYHPTLRDDTPGAVTILVVPSTDLVDPRAPIPDTLFLRAICEHVEPRRLITTEIHVVGPCYVPIWVSVGVKIARGYGRDAVLQRVREALETYLSPLKGGPVPAGEKHGRGWPLGRKVLARDLEAVVTRVDGVEYVEDELLLASESSRDTQAVTITGLELPRLMIARVTEGEPTPIEQVVGDVPVDGAGGTVVPVPVVPEVC